MQEIKRKIKFNYSTNSSKNEEKAIFENGYIMIYTNFSIYIYSVCHCKWFYVISMISYMIWYLEYDYAAKRWKKGKIREWVHCCLYLFLITWQQYGSTNECACSPYIGKTP